MISNTSVAFARHRLAGGTLFIAGLVVLAAACSSAPSGGCATNDDCAPGQACAETVCIDLCQTQTQCTVGLICLNGRCTEPVDGPLPQITAISGNDPQDGVRVLDGIIVTGTLLADASFIMTGDGGSLTPDVRSQASDRVELVFPADILSGVYNLTATNQAGSAQATVQLTLPDLTGDALLAKINDPTTTGAVAVGRLPVGTTAADVAAGDHAHDAANDLRYVNRTGDSMSGDLAVLGSLGVARATPTGVFEVGAGYTYGNTQPNSAQLTPRCQCDSDVLLADCGDPATTTEIYEFALHDAEVCYDHWDLAGAAGATQYTRVAGEPPLAGIVVTAEGKVGIGTSTPTARLQIQDPRAAGATFAFGSHAFSMRGVNDPLRHSHVLPYVEWRQASTLDPNGLPVAGLRAMYLGWGNYADPADPWVSLTLENNYDLAISGGNVGIGMTNPVNALHVSGNIGSTGWVGAGCETSCSDVASGYALLYADGNIRYTGTIAQASDRRLKTDIRTLDGALDSVMALRGVRYKRRNDVAGGYQLGVVAQEVETIYPELVETMADSEYKGVNYIGLVPVLLEAVKEQQRAAQAQRDAQRDTVRQLQAENERLQARLMRLEQSIATLVGRRPGE